MGEGMKFRKCYVLREIEIPMADLKIGDIFRLEKASEIDCVNPKEWSIVKRNAESCEPEGNTQVKAAPITFTEQIVPNFTNSN